MKTKRRLLTAFGVLVILLLAACFGGCDTEGDEGDCDHVWGEWTTIKSPTCVSEGRNKRQCEKCGELENEIIDALSHTPCEDDGDCTTPITCTVCRTVITEAAEHTGGEATCSARATCTVCGREYGEPLPHTPEADDGDCTTRVVCTVCGVTTTEATAGHTGGTATCVALATCSVCSMEYGELLPHTPIEDDGDCTTAVTCSVCDTVITPAREAHTGGMATCEVKARCSVCSKEYGELAPHSEETVWIKHIDEHYQAYACCRWPISEAQAHTRVDGVCVVCGYNPTITMSSVEASPGDTRVSITLSIEDNPGIAGLMVTVTYNSDALLLAGVEQGSALAPLTFTRPGALESGCTFMWDCVEISDQDIEDGVILTLIFDVSADAFEGDYSILLGVHAYDNDLRPFTLIISGGTITISNN